jgi:hypothetical protein
MVSSTYSRGSGSFMIEPSAPISRLKSYDEVKLNSFSIVSVRLCTPASAVAGSTTRSTEFSLSSNLAKGIAGSKLAWIYSVLSIVPRLIVTASTLVKMMFSECKTKTCEGVRAGGIGNSFTVNLMRLIDSDSSPMKLFVARTNTFASSTGSVLI